MGQPELQLSDEEIGFYRDTFLFAQEASKTSFEQFLRSEYDVQVQEIPDGDRVNFDHWLCSMAIDLGWSNIGLKLHYQSKFARKIGVQRLGMPSKLIPEKLLRDLIQEYLNLCMGKIKSRFGSDSMMVSLPISQPTGDQQDPRQDVIDRNSDSWKVVWPEGHFYLSCQIHLVTTIENAQKIQKDVEINLDSMEMFT